MNPYQLCECDPHLALPFSKKCALGNAEVFAQPHVRIPVTLRMDSRVWRCVDDLVV